MPILDRPWQYILVDFKKYLKSKTKYNIVVIFVNRLEKQPITISIRDTIIARELAPLFLLYIVYYIEVPKTIISNRGP